MSVERTILVHLTVDDLADEFARLGSPEQAEFFHAVAHNFRSWGAYHLDDAQLCDIGRALLKASESDMGAEWIRRLAEFAVPSRTSTEEP